MFDEERYAAREAATKLRNEHSALAPYFPVQEVARKLGLSCVSNQEAISRWQIALNLASFFRVLDRETFARSLLVPLYLLEPIIVAGKDTGERHFFGLFKKRASYSTWELASMFGVPEFVIDQQAQMLY